jgi:hypothetical protein
MIFALQHDPVIALRARNHPEAEPKTFVQEGDHCTTGGVEVVNWRLDHCGGASRA